jgi:hypothetical protein
MFPNPQIANILYGSRLIVSHVLIRRRARVQVLDFAQSARFHVENESAHGNIFGDPGMRPDFLDLLPGIVHVARPTESAAMK